MSASTQPSISSPLEVNASSPLLPFALLALFIEGILLIGFSWKINWSESWLGQLQSPKKDDRFIEAQVFQMPKQAHLIEKKTAPPGSRKKEKTLSRNPGKNKPQKPTAESLETENQTQEGPELAPTHGPVAVYAPAPAIPLHLQHRTFRSSVIIDFHVSALGHTDPHLGSSSGNEELDAIAIATAKKWQFRPAEKDHRPCDSQTRLRIVFEVR